MLNSAIIAKLKEGTVKSVALFSDGMELPPPPYVVVKPESGMIPGTRQYRIIAHTEQGRLDELENYIFTELPELLLNARLEDEEGRAYKLHGGDWSDVRPEQDGTICMERVFYIPFKL
jgi:hypothetical protein